MEANSALVAVNKVSPPLTKGEVSLVQEVISTILAEAEGGPSRSDNVIG